MGYIADTLGVETHTELWDGAAKLPYYLSLAASLQTAGDERVEQAVQEMLGGLWGAANG